MSDAKDTGRDYRASLFLPKTDFPMRAGLPKKEPEILKRWEEMDLYRRCREVAKGREKYVLHDGPPYANGHLHIGHALNKILKDIITRTRQMMGYDSNYVPGWDCHGLPIEWKVEERFRAEGKNKDEIPVNQFRAECRKFAEHWIDVQREEFIRLGVVGDWQNPYLTMAYEAEAIIAAELLKFARMGQLYRGSKPVMWSVVEKTALAEAEVEYHDHTSDTIWVKFPVIDGPETLRDAFVVIWTTTPWTIPGNRAISFNPSIAYGLYEVKAAPEGNWAQPGERYLLADALAEEVMKAARVEDFARIADVSADELAALACAHPLRDMGYGFTVPMLPGEHVTEESGTGFVHTAPGHGREDYDVWMQHARELQQRGIDTRIPFTVDEDGVLTKEAPGFEGKRVLTEEGKKGDANEAVIAALREAGMLIARARLKHQYPHSWRSKKPVIFRNTPQWFIPMDKPYEDGTTLRERALKSIHDDVMWVPPQGENRITAMIENRPDWVVSRQRAWGVPIALFVHKETGEILNDEEVDRRIIDSFREHGADAWFEDGAKERYLQGRVDNPDDWEQVRDILDVWFDSGSTHAFVLEQREDLKWPASMYLEGTDQHRGWFHSSLLESCGTRGRAPYESVLTHGFVLDEEGRKMSKSLGNVVSPQDVMKQYGADILRLWVMASDYSEDLRIGPEILKSMADAYRKLRNTIRYMLGALADYDPAMERVENVADMPQLERYILHRLAEVGEVVMKAYEAFDFKRAHAAIMNFMVNDLSAFYFDIRKDSLYCDPYSSMRRRACRTVIDTLFEHVIRWLAPWLSFTAEEAWWSRIGHQDDSVHLHTYLDLPAEWRDEALAERWQKIRKVRSVITGALEVERKEKRIGSSLEAAPVVFITDDELAAAVEGIDLAEVAITSALKVARGEGPAEAFRLDEVPGVAVVVEKARGRKCARSWIISEDVGSDPEFPDITPRDAEAVREWMARTGQTLEALEKKG